jgi:hypothetical protein
VEPTWKPGGAGDLVEAFSVTIGSFRGAVMGPGSDPQMDRGVQVHLDWLQSGGLIFYLVRGARATDSEIYPIDAYGQPTLAHLDAGARARKIVPSPSPIRFSIGLSDVCCLQSKSGNCTSRC